MMTLAVRVQRAIQAAGVPITGIAVGRLEDKATWKVFPPNLQSTAQPHIDAFVEPTPQQIADEDAAEQIGRKELRAVAEALWECIPNPTMTKAQMRTRAIAIWKTL